MLKEKYVVRKKVSDQKNYGPGPTPTTSLTTTRLDQTVGATRTWSRYRWHHCRLPHRPTKRCRALPLRVRILPAKHGYPHGFQYGKCARTEKEGHQRLHGRRTSFLVHPFCAFKRTPLATAHLLRNHFAHLNATVFEF